MKDSSDILFLTEAQAPSRKILERFAAVADVGNVRKSSYTYFKILLNSYFEDYLGEDFKGELRNKDYLRLCKFLKQGNTLPDERENVVALYEAFRTVEESWSAFLNSRPVRQESIQNDATLSPKKTTAQKVALAAADKAAGGIDSFSRRWKAMQNVAKEDARARQTQLQNLRERLGGNKDKYLILPKNLPALVKEWMEKACTKLGVVFQAGESVHCEPSPKEYLSSAEKDLSKIPDNVHEGVREGLIQLELLEVFLEWIPDKKESASNARTKAYRFVQMLTARLYCERRLNRKWSEVQNVFVGSAKLEGFLLASLSHVFGQDMASHFLRAYNVLLRNTILSAIDSSQDDTPFKQLIDDALATSSASITRNYPTQSVWLVKDKKTKKISKCNKRRDQAYKETSVRRPQVILGAAPAYPAEKILVKQFNEILISVPNRVQLSRDPVIRSGDSKRVAQNMTSLAGAVQQQASLRREALRAIVFKNKSETASQDISTREWHEATAEFSSKLENIQPGEVRDEGIETFVSHINQCLRLEPIDKEHPASVIEAAVLKLCLVGVTQPQQK